MRPRAGIVGKFLQKKPTTCWLIGNTCVKYRSNRFVKIQQKGGYPYGTVQHRPRVRKTKKQLRLALMELLAEKSAKSISVRELAERADINRGTFYIHYRDVGDLLQRLEDEMADRLTALCKEHKPEDSTGEQFPFLRDLYRFILDNADLCRVLLGPNGDIAYTDRICCILRDYFLYDFLSQFRPGDRQRLNHFCSFIVSGNLNLALSWLRDGGQESPDEMARLAGSIIMAA